MQAMEAVLEKQKSKAQRVSYYASALKRSQPNALKSGLRAMAQKLDSSVLSNSVTMQEIVDEVNAVRRERYEQNRI